MKNRGTIGYTSQYHTGHTSYCLLVGISCIACFGPSENLWANDCCLHCTTTESVSEPTITYSRSSTTLAWPDEIEFVFASIVMGRFQEGGPIGCCEPDKHSVTLEIYGRGGDPIASYTKYMSTGRLDHTFTLPCGVFPENVFNKSPIRGIVDGP